MSPTFRRLLSTSDDFTLTAARVVLAAIFIGHGTQKAFGWFGGPGFDRAIDIFQSSMGIPAALTIFVMFTEIAAALGMALGFLSRIAALGLLGLMIIAPFANHLYPRFFMNWTGNRPGEGYEYHLLAIALLLHVLAHGSGALSVDRMLTRSSAEFSRTRAQGA